MMNEELFERRILGFKSMTPGTGKSFLQFKLILSILFAVCIAHELLYSYFTVRFFRDQINHGTTRSGIQVLRTHAHFFTLSGIWSGVCLFLGLWAVIAEHFGFIIGYATMAFGGLVFQFMGSISSRDMTVVKLTAIGSVHEPILILVSLLFAHTIKSSTNKLDTSPIYRRTMVESRKSSLADVFTSLNLDQSQRRTSAVTGQRVRDNNWTLATPTNTLTGSGRPSRAINNHCLLVPCGHNHAFVNDEA